LPHLEVPEAKAYLHRIEWLHTAREKQVTPSGDWEHWSSIAGRGYGKALSLDTNVATSNGWVSMLKIKIGTSVFDEVGNPCKVKFVSEIMLNRPCYRVYFSDGTKIVCDERHEWITQCRASRKSYGRAVKPTIHPKKRTTKEILDTLSIYRKDGEKELNHSIKITMPIKTRSKKLIIDPYLLGLWLGDGESNGGWIYCNQYDIEELSTFTGGKINVGKNGRVGHLSFTKPRMFKKNGDFAPNGSLQSNLVKLDLIKNKHVPKDYLRSSCTQRKEILMGLMDSDGYINKNGHCEYTSIKHILAVGVYELICSLGIKATLIEGNATIDGRIVSKKYRVLFTPYYPVFKLKRKLIKVKKRGRQSERQLRRYITKVEKIKSVPVRCIQVDSPSNLFLVTKSFVATHNTRLAVEDIWWNAWKYPKSRLAAICATSSDTRHTAFEGESGFMEIMPHEIIEKDGYKKQSLQIHLINGSMIQGYTAEEPKRLRGPSWHRAWADEIATWNYPEALDMINFCLRLGSNPQLITTSTPKPVKLIIDIIKSKDKKIILSTGSTFENEQNLPKSFISSLKDKYEGTRLGRQELYAELLEDVEGALWNLEIIKYDKNIKLSDISRIVISIDPAVTKKKGSDETGIVVCGQIGREDKYIVIDDLSGKYSPNEWANKAIWAYDKYNADFIVAEVNNGGDLVETNIRTVDKNANIIKVHASKGKYVRAEPIAALYEQNKVVHLKNFELLENQMVTYTPESDIESPDRMDALVWGLTKIAISKKSLVYNFA